VYVGLLSINIQQGKAAHAVIWLQGGTAVATVEGTFNEVHVRVVFCAASIANNLKCIALCAMQVDFQVGAALRMSIHGILESQQYVRLSFGTDEPFRRHQSLWYNCGNSTMALL